MINRLMTAQEYDKPADEINQRGRMLNELWAGLIGAGNAIRLHRLYFIGLVYSYPFAMGTLMVHQIFPRGSYTLLEGEKGKECVSPNNGNSYIIYPQDTILFTDC
jgi:hypothetical protein